MKDKAQGGAPNPGEVLCINPGVDTSEWRRNVLADHPHILELTQRISVLQRAVTFGKHFRPGKPAVRQGLTWKQILPLVLHHLDLKGLKETKKALEKEAKLKTPVVPDLSESRLVYYLLNALKNTEKVFDLAVADKGTTELELEEHLYSLSLLEDEIQEEDVNIWLEPEENIVVEKIRNAEGEEEEVVKAGSFNKLVERLTPVQKHDMQFVKTLLMTYQSFATPEKLLTKLIQRFHAPKNHKSVADDKQAAVIQLRVCNVARKWIEDDKVGADFDEKVTALLRTFVEQIKPDHPTLASMLTHSLAKKEKETVTGPRRFSEKTPEPIVPRNIFSSKLTIHDIEEEEIARQLTLIEFDTYAAIKPSELLNQSWNKPKLKHRAQNVARMIDRFNQVSMWVATMIMKVAKVKPRARMMAKFIKIAEHLRDLNNYNSLMAIIAGLSFSSVFRLHWTREEMPAQPQKTMKELEQIMSSESSFKVYRQRLAASDPPCIPYLGVYLTDLTFMDENPDNITVETSHGCVSLINFAKRKMVYNVISLIQQYQQKSYNLQPVHQIAQFLTKLPAMDEQELYLLSLKREPRKSQRADIQ